MVMILQERVNAATLSSLMHGYQFVDDSKDVEKAM